MATSRNIIRFKEAMHLVYGPFDDLTEEAARVWVAPENPGAGGHRGRYLWTDAFGVINFITLSKETSSPVYLTLAKRLVQTVHDVLGKTRDGTARLPGASEAEPLKGGLRIGKVQATGSDGDGQYHHYLTLWMFALNRLALATEEKQYNQLAVQLAKAIHPHFVTHQNGLATAIVWKKSVDLQQVLVPREGHLDALTGFAVYRLLQRTAEHLHPPATLANEIADYRALMGREKASYDPLDLGMGLWICHFFRDEVWARALGSQSLDVAMSVLNEETGVLGRESSRRLAFREFGMVIGLECFGKDGEFKKGAEAVVDFWQGYLERSEDEDLRPIALVMYAAALIPGGKFLFEHFPGI